jgi:nucleoside-diphosphate-sugar epimerase
MRLLVLGGTAFLGHAVAREALGRGHEVVCLARGLSGTVPDGAELVRLDRADPRAGLAGVEDRRWDAVVDVGRDPGPVGRAARWLAPGTGHAVFVSTVNVYADHSLPEADESTPLLAPREVPGEDPDAYGAAKVACEQHVLEAFGPDRTLVARAGLIGGPGDVTGRSGYWPWRFAHPAAAREVLVPDAPGQAVQLLDVRDLAGWLVRSAEGRVAGVVDAVGAPTTLADVLTLSAEVSGSSAEAVPADAQWLGEHGVEPWMGSRSLPLWLPWDGYAGFATRTGAAGAALGLESRPPADTLADVLAYEERRSPDRPRRAGLADEDERALLRAWHAGR